MPRILIVDDEPDILDVLEFNLANSGFAVERALKGRLALESAKARPPDLIVLDEMLPDIRGFEVLRNLRGFEATRTVPVILLTARSAEGDKLVAFELGADDYLTKPFSPGELLARIRAVLKRTRGVDGQTRVVASGGVSIDLDGHRVSCRGEEVELTPQEFRLLAYLATHPNRVYSREQLISQAWDADVMVDPRTVDVHIRRLRARLEQDPNNPALIETVRGSGYRLNSAP